MVNSKHAFWQALVFTILVFVIGLFLGFFLENSRADKLEFDFINSEMNLLDETLRNQIISELDVDCESAIDSTFEFADKIYWEAINLEQYDSASKLGDDLKILHKRYDLLRTLLWIESVKLRADCQGDFHTVVYFYDYGTEDVGIRAEQLFFSRLLEDIKERHAGDVLLIPIAADLDLVSVNLALERYGVESLPVVVVDEEIVIDEVLTLEELEKIIFR